MMAATIEYDENYLYWDNVESLSVAMRQAADDSIKTATTVPCQRVNPPSTNAPNYSGADMDTEILTWRVPAALLYVAATPGTVYPLQIGDRLFSATEAWRVIALTEVRNGSSLSHYLATTNPER